MVAVPVGIVDKVILMFFMGGVEDGALPHICGDALLLVAAELACVDSLLVEVDNEKP
jgi:hypothetical protein